MGFFPANPPPITLLTLADVISNLKNVSTRNKLISRTSVNLGFETSGSVLFQSGVASDYATSTSVSGTLVYPNGLTLDSHWTTVLTFNEGASPGTTVVNVKGGAYNVADEAILYSKTSGVGSPFKLDLFQVPIGIGNLTSVQATFNKASSTSVKNSQQVYILPGKWGNVTQSNATGGSNSSLSATAGDIAFITGGLSRSDSSISAITHSGTAAHTRIIETVNWYGGTSGQIALHVIDTTGTFNSNAGSVTVSTGGGGHGGGGTITYYYDCFSQLLRFIEP